MSKEQIKLRFSNVVKAITNGNKSVFARTIGISPQNLGKYMNGDVAIGIVMRNKLKSIGIESEYITFYTKSESIKILGTFGVGVTF